jgi:hypothetical protein
MLRLHRDDAETLIAPGLAPSRPALGACEEVLDCLIEVPQCLLVPSPWLRPPGRKVISYASEGAL